VSYEKQRYRAMNSQPVGLLLDTVYDNTGDKAIRLAMEDFLHDRGILYEVLDPLEFDVSVCSRLIIGGGHLIRDPDGGYYDRFRVPGPHLLNAVGLTATRDLDYLRAYDYVSVRSSADRDRLVAAVPDVAVVPCVSLVLKGKDADFPVKRPAIGFQFSSAAFPACDGADAVLRELSDRRKLFVPLMHYASDRDCMQRLAEAVPGSDMAPYLQPRQALNLISQLDAFVSCSLHGCLFAYVSNVPFLALDSEGTTKIQEFMRDRGLEEWLFRDGRDLAQKLPLLLNHGPDYSRSISRDIATINQHFNRIESILKGAPTGGALPSVAEASVAAHIRRLQVGSSGRDFDLARLRNEHSIALAKKDTILADRERTIARQHELISERDAALAAKDASLAAKDALLGEKDAALAQNDAALGQKDAAIADKDRHIANIEATLHHANVQAASSLHQLEQITNSVGYRLLERVRRPIRWLTPEGSRRRGAFVAFSKGLNIIMGRGWRAFFARLIRVREWLPRLRAVSIAAHATLDDQYQVWLQAHALTPARARRMKQQAARLHYRPLVSIVMPVYNPEPAWLRDAIESVRAQLYDNWELCIADDGSSRPGVRELLEETSALDRRIMVTYLGKNQGIAGASNAALALASGEFIGLLDHDDELKPDALFEVARLLNERRDLDYVYSDEDKRDPDGRLVEPFFKPDWSPDLHMSINYVTHFSVFRKALVNQVGGFRRGYDGSQDYDLVLRVTEIADRVAHIAKPLYTWRKVPGSAASSVKAKKFAFRAAKKALKDALTRRGLKGKAADGLWKGSYRVRYEIARNPRVSIVIPTRDRVDMLRRCIASIKTKSTYRNYEIIVADNDSQEQGTLDYLSSFEGTVIRYPEEFNFAKIINTAAKQASGDALIFLNNDTEVISPEWIEAMLEQGQRSEVAAVGARLLYPDGRVQHEGIIMGLGTGSALNVDHGGYFGLGECVHNCSAVTGACMLTRPSLFRELGGFDERLRVAFNDVDFCLRARQEGYRIVYTPFAALYHYESASRGSLHPDEDEKLFRRRWGNPGEYRDPYYNPNLDLRRPFNIAL
jgi:GT2 family glycosyltransferase